MVGFWKVRVRPKPRGPDGRPGASMDLAPLLAQQQQPQPQPHSQPQPQPQQLPAWVAQGRAQLEDAQAQELREAPSLLGAGLKEGRGGLEGPLPCVWERLVHHHQGQDGGEEERGAPCSTPLYDQCFQGF